MIGKVEIHNSAILKPQFVKCPYWSQYRTHAFADSHKGYKQCIECGIIKEEYVHKLNTNSKPITKGTDHRGRNSPNNPHPSSRPLDRQNA